MITNPPAAPTLLDYHRQNEADDYDLPRGTYLGARCCGWCGHELGDVKQIDGTYRNYHDTQDRCLARDIG